MSNANFRRDLARLLKAAGDKAEMVVRKTAMELQTSMVNMSPVDTGRFRGNWACGIGSVNTSTGAAEDKSGQGAIASTAAALGAWKPGQTILLTNSLPYSRRLEYGWSKQSPGGMVRLTVQNYGKHLAEAVWGLP